MSRFTVCDVCSCKGLYSPANGGPPRCRYCVRKTGHLVVAVDLAQVKALRQLGLDPEDWCAEALASAIEAERRKCWLQDQCWLISSDRIGLSARTRRAIWFYGARTLAEGIRILSDPNEANQVSGLGSKGGRVALAMIDRWVDRQI